MKLAINQIFSKTITVETMVGQYALFHFRTLFFINYAKYVINLFQLRSLPHQFTKGRIGRIRFAFLASSHFFCNFAPELHV